MSPRSLTAGSSASRRIPHRPSELKQSSEQDLFDIPQARKATEPTVQTTIRVTDSQHHALAELAETHGANRSQLITAALRLYLS